MVKVVPATDLTTVSRALAADELVIVPTSRWYLICGRARSPTAAQEIFAAKARPVSKVLMLCLHSADAAGELFQMGADAEVLADHFWPGDMLLRLRWRSNNVARNHEGVGTPVALVGVPGGFLNRVLSLLGEPLVASSANVSGAQKNGGTDPPISLDEALSFASVAEPSVGLVVDGGICREGEHLTIVDVSGPSTFIEREGTLHRRAVSAALQRSP